MATRFFCDYSCFYFLLIQTDDTFAKTIQICVITSSCFLKYSTLHSKTVFKKNQEDLQLFKYLKLQRIIVYKYYKLQLQTRPTNALFSLTEEVKSQIKVRDSSSSFHLYIQTMKKRCNFECHLSPQLNDTPGLLQQDWATH